MDESNGIRMKTAQRDVGGMAARILTFSVRTLIYGWLIQLPERQPIWVQCPAGRWQHGREELLHDLKTFLHFQL